MVFHQLANDFDYMFQSKAKDMTPEEASLQENVNHYFTAVNLMVLALLLCLLDVHWVSMGSGLTVFCLIQTVQVYRRFNAIFIDFFVTAIIV